eukprot:gene11491-15390_t
MKSSLRLLPSNYIETQSSLVLNKLIQLQPLLYAGGVSIYLSMPSEVNTNPIVNHLFETNKKVIIPKIVGKKSEDMLMISLNSIEAINNFPKNRWGIPEPVVDVAATIADQETVFDIIDVVLVPGVAFDSACGRVGHGKGYYDCFLDRLMKYKIDHQQPLPTTIGIALDEQIIPSAPMENHDIPLDFVVTPTRIFNKSHLDF